MDDTPEFDYQVDLKIEDIYLLHHCVEETFINWPGAPARAASWLAVSRPVEVASGCVGWQ